MRLPDDLVIPDGKITRYLLLPKARSDKSKFLAKAGFTLNNPDALKLALQRQGSSNDAIEERTDQYGTFYQVQGELVGVNGVSLWIISIWLHRRIDGKFQFVTLVPCKEKQS